MEIFICNDITPQDISFHISASDVQPLKKMVMDDHHIEHLAQINFSTLIKQTEEENMGKENPSDKLYLFSGKLKLMDTDKTFNIAGCIASYPNEKKTECKIFAL